MQTQERIPTPVSPPATLLYNDECSVCRAVAGWIRASMAPPPAPPSLVVQPIGDDPDALRALLADLDIWDAYATIHLLMPDGSMKLGGGAVAEVLRRLPATHALGGIFDVAVGGVRPLQMLLNGAYTVLADARPLLGCESRGTTSGWVRSTAARAPARDGDTQNAG